MTNDHIISVSASMRRAAEQLNELSGRRAMTLLVVDASGRTVGTVTDGDVRRAIVRGAGLDTPIEELMNRSFAWLPADEVDPAAIRAFKERGIQFLPLLDAAGRAVRTIDLNEVRTLLPIDAVLMAGGRGERLRPLTLDTPKPLLTVADKPIIDYNVDNLRRYGVERIAVTVNYLAEQVEAHFASDSSVRCVREPHYLGTMGAVKLVDDWRHDTVLVMNSDLFTNIDLEDFFLHFKQHGADMSVAAVPYSVNVPYGIFEIEGVRTIKGVREKPSFHYYANAGIYLLKRSVLDLIPADAFFNATDLMNLLVARGQSVIRFPLSGYWIDIGKPEDFQKAQELVKHTSR